MNDQNFILFSYTFSLRSLRTRPKPSVGLLYYRRSQTLESVVVWLVMISTLKPSFYVREVILRFYSSHLTLKLPRKALVQSTSLKGITISSPLGSFIFELTILKLLKVTNLDLQLIMHGTHLNAYNQGRKLQFQAKHIQCNTMDQVGTKSTNPKCMKFYIYTYSMRN